MHECEICGNTFEIERPMHQGGDNDAGYIYCPFCGTQIVKLNKCLQCGKDLPLEAKFCMVCGAKIEGGAERVCSKCGTKAMPGSVFCNQCGEKL